MVVSYMLRWRGGGIADCWLKAQVGSGAWSWSGNCRYVVLLHEFMITTYSFSDIYLVFLECSWCVILV